MSHAAADENGTVDSAAGQRSLAPGSLGSSASHMTNVAPPIAIEIGDKDHRISA